MCNSYTSWIFIIVGKKKSVGNNLEWAEYLLCMRYLFKVAKHNNLEWAEYVLCLTFRILVKGNKS